MGFTLGNKTEKAIQLFFTEDRKFSFRKRSLLSSSMIEKQGDTIRRGWKHFYNNQFFFPGYKKMTAGMITLGFSRDIILDPFNKVKIGNTMGEKPNSKDAASLKKWIARIAENMRHTYQSNRKSSLNGEIVNYALTGVIMLEIIGWVIGFLTKG